MLPAEAQAYQGLARPPARHGVTRSRDLRVTPEVRSRTSRSMAAVDGSTINGRKDQGIS
jgi:hypothetical protein